MQVVECCGVSERRRYGFFARVKYCVSLVDARCCVSSQVGSVIVDDVVVKCVSSVLRDVVSS